MNENDDETERDDYLTEVIQEAVTTGNRVLEAVNTVAAKAMVERLITTIMEYREKTQRVIVAVDRAQIDSATVRVNWAAQAMQALIATGAEADLAWDICQWAWPPGFDWSTMPDGLQKSEIIGKLVAQAMAPSSPPPGPPSFIKEEPVEPPAGTYVGRNAVVGPYPGKPGTFIITYGDGTHKILVEPEPFTDK